MTKHFKVEPMDLGKEHIPILEEWLTELYGETGGITVPIRALECTGADGETCYDEWEPSNTWADKEE